MKAAFPEVERIRYEGPESKNPLAFRHYNPDEKIGGKTMRDHLRFSVVYWHTFRNPLADPFGPGTAVRPGRTAPTPSKTPRTVCAWPSNSWRNSAIPSMPFTIATLHQKESHLPRRIAISMKS